MTTLIFQTLLPLPKLIFAVLALAGASSMRDEGTERRRRAWKLVGVAFLISAVHQALHMVWAIAAYHAGQGTLVYSEYIRYAPALNHSRTFLAAALALLFIVRQRSERTSLLLLLAGLFAGAVVGVLEGPLVPARHFAVVTVTEAVALFLFLGALIRNIRGERMDRLLWLSLAVYGGWQTTATLFSSMKAVWGTGVWTPDFAVTYMIAICVWSLMAALAYHRLRLARRGIPVPALLEPARSRDPSMMGWK